MTPSAKLRRTFIALALSTLVVFAALLIGLASVLGNRLRAEVLQRQAGVIYAVALMQINSAEARLNNLRAPLTDADVFTAVLESSRLSGVLAVQVLDGSGNVRDALPAILGTLPAEKMWWDKPLGGPQAQFHPDGSLEEAFDLPREPNTEVLRTPLLEVVVPLGRRRGDGSLGVARYWIDGQNIQTELQRTDRRLYLQAAAALLIGGVIIGLLLIWSYCRLASAQKRLVEQALDLARANEELDFAAKTGALGAISAHLIHGLKSPLAGLEGFVNEAASSNDTALGEARQTAVETTRRLRSIVNEVLTVLRDESSGTANYAVPVNEVLEAVHARANPAALSAGITLAMNVTGEPQLRARTANLAGLVLANLLANAIQASASGTQVRVEAVQEGTNIHFTVADQGPGLPESVRASLFRPLVSGKSGGSGIGLAISCRLARHAGGELVLVESDERGTVFRLAVPALEVRAAGADRADGGV